MNISLRRDDRRCGELAVEWQQLAAFADFEAAAASGDRVAGETAAPHSEAYEITQRYELQILPGGLVAQVPGADDPAHGQAAIQVISTIVQPNVARAVRSKNTRLVIVP